MSFRSLVAFASILLVTPVVIAGMPAVAHEEWSPDSSWKHSVEVYAQAVNIAGDVKVDSIDHESRSVTLVDEREGGRLSLSGPKLSTSTRSPRGIW